MSKEKNPFDSFCLHFHIDKEHELSGCNHSNYVGEKSECDENCFQYQMRSHWCGTSLMPILHSTFQHLNVFNPQEESPSWGLKEKALARPMFNLPIYTLTFKRTSK